MPTFNRQHMHEAIYQCFLHQDHPDRDLWVLDDSAVPSPFLCSVRERDERVHYIHHGSRITIGHKRNALIEQSRGDVIAHFDDDDWYAPQYLSSMIDRLTRHDADFVKLGRWNERRTSDNHSWTYEAERNSEANRWGWGFSYVYRRWVSHRVSFPHINGGEDYSFLCGIRKAHMSAVLVSDGANWVEHRLHGSNTTRKG